MCAGKESGSVAVVGFDISEGQRKPALRDQ